MHAQTLDNISLHDHLPLNFDRLDLLDVLHDRVLLLDDHGLHDRERLHLDSLDGKLLALHNGLHEEERLDRELLDYHGLPNVALLLLTLSSGHARERDDRDGC